MNKFLIGLVFGIAIAGGLAVYLNNEPTQFVKKNVTSGSSMTSSNPVILAPGTKLKEVASDTEKASAPTSYDFYDVLQARKVANSSEPATPKAASAPKPLPNTKIMVQAGAFTDEELASDMKGRLALMGIDSSIITQKNGDKSVSKVLIGPFSSDVKAQKTINQLSDQQINAVLIRVTK